MVVVEVRPRWRLMVLVEAVDGSGKRRWTHVAVVELGRVFCRVGRGWRRVVTVVEIDAVDGGGDKGVVVMESRVEETALAVFDGGCRWLQLMAEGLEATALAVWVGERGRKRERRWTLLGVVVVAGRGDDDARRRL